MTARDDITALLLDVGNTNARAAGWHAFDGGALSRLGAWPTSELVENPRANAELNQLRQTWAGRPVFISSVVPRLKRQLQALWPEARFVDHNIALPYKCALPQPEKIGPDRICNMAAAAAAGLKRALVVDAGTATTFDLLLDGEFVGGLIAPGMATAGKSLAERADRLAEVGFASCPLEVGRDTTSAMRAGIFHAGIGGVVNLTERIVARYQPLPVVLTGGLAHHLPGALGSHEPDWTLRGIAVLAGLA